MSDRPGENLPGFVAHQLDFSAHIRNPEQNPVPEGIEARRMAIYTGLFYRNIEGFLANAFPVCKKIASSWDGVEWHDLVRSFVHRHGSESPYFLDIPQEFMEFVSSGEHEPLPDWFLELAHYEWVEMALAVSDEEIPEAGYDAQAQLTGHVQISPLIWPLSYRYAVQKIGPDHLPQSTPEQPSHLIVYRRRDDMVKFLETNAVTLALLHLLSQPLTVEAAVEQLAEHLNVAVEQVAPQAQRALEQLRECDIVLGSRNEDSM